MWSTGDLILCVRESCSVGTGQRVNTVLKYSSGELVLYFSVFILCCFIFPLHNILDTNIVLFTQTLLHYVSVAVVSTQINILV